eukprot:SAG31_NODE_1117_length_9817_cov_6.416650_8_plen_291_part_00
MIQRKLVVLPLLLLLLLPVGASEQAAGWGAPRSFSDGVSQANISGAEELLLAHTLGADGPGRGQITGWWSASSHDHLTFVYTWPTVPTARGDAVPLRTDDAAAAAANYTNQIWASAFGATGSGRVDDAAALQSAIDACRSSNRTLHIADGRYSITRPLLWADWPGISVKGETAGAGGYNDAAPATLAIIAAPSLRGLVANDFTRSMYGVVEGIAFQNEGQATSNRPSVQVLIARSEPGDGSELTVRRCNFGAGSTASVVIHMSEVITFEACRWSPSLGAPGLVITYRADR